MFSLKKRKYFIILILFFVINCLMAKEIGDLSWFKLNETNNKNWNFKDINKDGIKGKFYFSKTSKFVNYSVIAVCSKKSSSYILAFNKFLEVLTEKLPDTSVSFYNFSKDDSRIQDIFKYAKKKDVNLILAMGSETMVASNKYFKGEKIPVVTCINKDPVSLGLVKDYLSGSGSNIAFTSVNVPTNVMTEWLFKFNSKIKNVSILYDPDHSSVVGSEVKPFVKVLKKLGIGVIKLPIAGKEDSEVERAIKEKVLYAKEKMKLNDPNANKSVFWLTSSTNIFSRLKTLSSFIGKVPLISSVPNTVNSKDESALMAIGIDRRNSAQLASLYAVEIMKGSVSPGDLPVGVVTPPDISINFKSAKRINKKIPFALFENASFIYGYDGEILRSFGENVAEFDQEKK